MGRRARPSHQTVDGASWVRLGLFDSLAAGVLNVGGRGRSRADEAAGSLTWPSRLEPRTALQS
jgi:hypothetical protein